MFGSHHSNTALGIDIGTTSIKAAEVTSNGKGVFTLSNYALLEISGHLEHFNNTLQSSSLKPLESDIIDYLKLLKSKANFKTNHVTVSLPAFSAFTTLLELPMANSKETAQSLSQVAKNYIPIPIATANLDWIKVGEKTYPDGAKKQRIFLISIPNDRIEAYTQMFARAGFQIDSFEVENRSATRALTFKTDSPQLIIDIGGRSTSISVGQKGIIKYSGQTDFSSDSLTQALSSALNINPRRADTMKRQIPIIGQGGNHELSTILIPVIDVILNEAKRIVTGFESSYGQKIAGVILTGSGSNMPGFDAYVAEQMHLPVSSGNALTNCAYPVELESFAKHLGPTLTVAIGLALKNLI